MFKKFPDSELNEHHELKSRLPEHAIRCSHCQTLITDAEQKFDKSGAHQHTCTNPAQQTFNIGCFKNAPGCIHVGTPTGDHTWFPGYSWCIAICNSCRSHLGWMFLSAHDRFHGLILNAIVEE